jgi:high-affinity nickel permease
MTRQERAHLASMYGFVVGLHVLGFSVFFLFVVPSHYKGLGIGVLILTYTLGLLHASDADHIAAIDNTTRKVMTEGHWSGRPRPFGFGFFFSLGHSTVVVAVGIAVIVAEKTVLSAVSHHGSGLEQFGGLKPVKVAFGIGKERIAPHAHEQPDGAAWTEWAAASKPTGADSMRSSPRGSGSCAWWPVA